MNKCTLYGVNAEFRDKTGVFPEDPSGVKCSYKSKAAAKKRFGQFVASGVYDRVMIVLQNARYLPDDKEVIAYWEK